MTGYTVHTGSTEQFSEGWDRIFSGGSQTPGRKAPKAKAGSVAKKKKPHQARTKKKS